MAKTDGENCNTYPCIQTDSGRLAFRVCGLLGRHQESYLPELRVYKEHARMQEYKCLIIIHMNFDHAWVEDYPITLKWSPFTVYVMLYI